MVTAEMIHRLVSGYGHIVTYKDPMAALLAFVEVMRHSHVAVCLIPSSAGSTISSWGVVTRHYQRGWCHIARTTFPTVKYNLLVTASQSVL